ncbi:ribonuclease H-like domain-containing protein, partial [Rhodofomes roseus]
MNDVLASTQSLPGAIATLYGPVECTDRRAIHVYTDGSYFKLPDGSERAGAGIYWGYGSPKNCALMVPTPVSNNRAELYAILRAITVADPCRTLRIHTDSTYAIHSICHWAPRNSALGWRKANGDLLRNIVDLIKRRTAAVVFIWVKGHSGNASNEAADELAGWGA